MAKDRARKRAARALAAQTGDSYARAASSPSTSTTTTGRQPSSTPAGLSYCRAGGMS